MTVVFGDSRLYFWQKSYCHQTVIQYMWIYSVAFNQLYLPNCMVVCKYEHRCHGYLLDFIENLKFWSARDRI